MDTKICSECRERKSLSEFNKNRSMLDGHAWLCRPCNRAYQSQWAATPLRKKLVSANKKAYRAANWERVRTQERARFDKDQDANKKAANERSVLYRRRHPDRVAAIGKQYREGNKTQRVFWQMTREARKKQAIPAWADMGVIKTIYADCPPGHHVDHIIALKAMRGRKHVACGLHCEANLQYLPAAENCQKWATLPEDVPAA